MAYPRIINPLGLYHIYGNGAFELVLFKDEEDKAYFIILLKEKSKEHNFEVHAFVIMDTHYHFSGYDPDNKFQKMMQGLLRAYSYYYKNKYGRCGYLYMERFQSKSLNTPMYVIDVSSYIHNNPKDIPSVRGKEETYKYSSYSKYIGKENHYNNFVKIDYIMKLMGYDNVSEFNKLYFEYTKAHLKS